MATTIIVTPATPGNDPEGHYADLNDLIAVDGLTSLQTYSSLDGETPGTLVVERVQRALTFADARVDAYLKGKIETVPVAESADNFVILTQAAALFATAYLYGSRGARDVVDVTTGQFNPLLNKANFWNAEAKRLLALYVESAADALPTAGGFQSVRMKFGPTCTTDEFSS